MAQRRTVKHALVGRYQSARTTLLGTLFRARGRDATGALRSPYGWFVEGAHNVRPETTAFTRFEVLEAGSAGTAHTRVVSLGVTQRIPHSGRVVLEISNDRTGVRTTRSVALDLVVMY